LKSIRARLELVDTKRQRRWSEHEKLKIVCRACWHSAVSWRFAR
jgi:hypothetical protein